VDADHPVQTYFPERKWAIMIPTTLFILVLAVTGTFVGLVMIKSGKKRS
jgi:dolichyl-phosphate mannosyltransferase polypeptide 2 regulatory subunit